MAIFNSYVKLPEGSRRYHGSLGNQNNIPEPSKQWREYVTVNILVESTGGSLGVQQTCSESSLRSVQILGCINGIEATRMKRAQHHETGRKSQTPPDSSRDDFEGSQNFMFVGPVVEIFEMSLKSLSLSVKFPCSSSFDEKIKIK